MATTLDSLYMTVGTDDSNVNGGWSIRVLDYKDMTTLIAVVSEFTAMSFTQELSGTGTGSITLDDDSTFWGFPLENGQNRRLIQKYEYIFEAWENGVARFAWVGQNVSHTLIGEDETKAVVISGPGIAQHLKRAKVWRPGWPTTVPILSYQDSVAKPGYKIPIYRETSYNDKLSAFKWEFPVSWPTMRMWYTLFKAAQRRGLIKWVNLSFGALKDSAGKPWQLIKTVSTASGEGYMPDNLDATLLDFLNDCTGQDYSKWFGQRLEWMMYPGFKLDVRPMIGADRSSTVRFFPGIILTDERTQDRENIFNRVTAQDVDGNETNVSDASSIKVWGLREQWNTTQKEITDTNLRNQIASRLLAQQKDEKVEFTVKIPYDSLGRVPYRNFFVGDWVGFNVDDLGYSSSAVLAPMKMRVKAITISISGDSPIPDCEITLQSIFQSRLDTLEKQITQLVNNPRNIDFNDVVSINANPVDGSTLVYNPETKKWEAVEGTGGTGTGGGGTVYVGTADPAATTGNTVKAGDFWLETY